VQDIRVQKVGLTAAKLELDARPLNETFLGTALHGNQFFGVTAALLEVGYALLPTVPLVTLSGEQAGCAAWLDMQGLQMNGVAL
jgi:hypothetical protein